MNGWGVRLYALLARCLLPRRLEAEFGDEVRDTFARRWSETGSFGRPVLLVGAVGDLVAEALVALAGGASRAVGRAGEDVLETLRSLGRAPGVPVVSAVLLSVGFALTTAAFAVLDGIQLRPLAFQGVDHLVRVEGSAPRQGGLEYALPPAVRGALGAVAGVEGVAAHREGVSHLGDPEGSRPLEQARVLDVDGAGETLRPQLVRGHAPTEPGTIAVTRRFWRDRLGSDPEVLGRLLVLDDTAYTVVGVLADGVGLGLGARIWRARDLSRDDAELVARLDGSLAAAGLQDRLDGITDALVAEGTLPEGLALTLRTSLVDRSRGVGPLLWIFTAASLLVLTVLVANVGALLAVRGLRRTEELAVRRALGASVGRLVVGALLESGVVVAGAVVAGALLARGLVGFLLGLEVAGGPLASAWPAWVRPEPDARAFLGSAAVGLLVALVASLGPAVHAARTAPVRSLGAGAGNSGGPLRSRLRDGLVTLQLGGVFVLSVSVLLLWRSGQVAREGGAGADGPQVAEVAVSLHPGRSADEAEAYVERVLTRLRALPGVGAAVEGEAGALRGDDRPGPWRVVGPAGAGVRVRVVSQDWFGVRGRAFVSGRPPEGGAGGPLEVVVTRALAEALGPEGALGGTVTLAGPDGEVRAAIVGLAEAPPQVTGGRSGTRLRPTLEAYLGGAQVRHLDDPTFAVRTRGPARNQAGELLGAVREVSPEHVVFAPRVPADRASLETDIVGAVFQVLLAIGVPVALLGLHALLAHAVHGRTREFGIRLALGASPAGLVRGLAARGVRLGLAGALVGTPLAFILASALGFLFLGVEPLEPGVYLGSAGSLAVAAGALALASTRRMGRLQAVEALRTD